MSPSRAVLLLPIVLACFHEAGGRAPAPRHVGPVERPLPVGAIARLGSTRLRHDSEVRAVTFSPDGRKIASVDSDQKARIWDALTGRMLNEFDTPEIFSHGFDDEADHTFVFTPDGKKLAAGVGADICFWDVQSGQEVRRFHGEGEGIRALTVSSDSKTFYCGGDDNKLHQWDIATGKHIRSWDYFGAEQPKRYANGRPHKKAVLAAVSPDGKSAVWHVLPVREHNTLERREDGPLVVWNVATRKEQWRLKGKEGKDFRGPRVAFSREGAYLTAYDEYSPLTVWHAASGKVFEKLGDKSATSWVAYSPDSRRVAVLNHAEGQGLRMWDLASGKELWKREQSLCMSGSGTSLTFAPDGKTLALANRNNVLLWDQQFPVIAE